MNFFMAFRFKWLITNVLNVLALYVPNWLGGQFIWSFAWLQHSFRSVRKGGKSWLFFLKHLEYKDMMTLQQNHSGKPL